MPGIQSFLETVRETIRLKHLSIHTEDTYLSTIKRFIETINRFIEFHDKRHFAHLPPDTAR